MSTETRYALPAGTIDWTVPQSFNTTFRWEYEDGRAPLLALYAKGKARQWNAAERIDWSLALDPENPEQLPDESMPIFGSEPYRRMTPAERVRARTHFRRGSSHSSCTASRARWCAPRR